MMIIMQFAFQIILLAVGFGIGYWLIITANKQQGTIKTFGQALGCVLIVMTLILEIFSAYYSMKISNREYMQGVFPLNKNDATQKDYFKVFLNLLGDDCFALSFTDTTNRENVLYMNVDYATPFVYIALNIFIQRKSFKKMKSIVLYTRCESHTIPTVFNMKYMGINDIYFTKCPSNIVDPALTDWMKQTLELKTYTNPLSDFKDMLKEISD